MLFVVQLMNLIWSSKDDESDFCIDCLSNRIRSNSKSQYSTNPFVTSLWLSTISQELTGITQAAKIFIHGYFIQPIRSRWTRLQNFRYDSTLSLIPNNGCKDLAHNHVIRHVPGADLRIWCNWRRRNVKTGSLKSPSPL